MYKKSKDKYAMKGMGKGELGQASAPKKVPTTSAEKYDMGRMQIRPMNKLGYASEAFAYKY